ncbi:hypothetical protein [Thiolapillus sp.]
MAAGQGCSDWVKVVEKTSSFWKLVKAVVTLTVVKAVVTLTLAKWSRL